MQRLRQLVKLVDIDKDGVFKYIQIRLIPYEATQDRHAITIVRGYLDCEYHADILAKFTEQEFTDTEL